MQYEHIPVVLVSSSSEDEFGDFSENNVDASDSN